MSALRPGRLAVITNDYPPKPGGIQQYLGSLVDAYPGEVWVLAPADEPATTTRGEEIVRRHRHRFMWPTDEVARWIEGELADFAPELILFGAPHPLTRLTGRLRRRVRVPVGVLCHGAEVTIPAAVPGARRVLGRALAAADVRLAVSRFTARHVEAITSHPVAVIGGGVDVDRFVPQPQLASDGLVVGCVSRFVPRKGQHRVIDAVARMRRNGHPAEVLLVGRGRMEDALRRRAVARNVPVRFAVDVPWDELPGLYAEMDVFCMPCRSRWGGLEAEGLGLVFLEAAACGLPVLAGDSGGAAETVVPGHTGYVVRSDTDILQALEMIATDRSRAAEMGARGRDRVVADFTWDAVVTRLIAAFAAA